MKKSAISLFGVIFTAILFLAAPSGAREGCRVCGMYIDVYQRTATHLVDRNGNGSATCGIACMMRLITDAGGPDAFREIRVRDFTSGAMVDAAAAAYVIGSDTVPDMLPNLIAFSDRQAAEAFAREHGGEVLGFDQALLSISPMAMTMPARLKSAAIPARGGSMAGLGHMEMKMDEVALGAGYVDPADFVRRPMQMMGPKEMTTKSDMFMAAHSVTDNDNIAVKIPYIKKKMEMYQMGGAKVSTMENSALGDIELSWRHNLWKNAYYSRFFTGLAAVTLPTGDFDTEWITSPGMQTGRGDFSFTAGILYSQRMGNFWLHSSLTYNHSLENSDDYQFGDVTSLGAAIHYTPNYDLLVGLEIDGSEYSKNEYQGVKQDNTGGFRSFATAVVNWKFLTALGGNFSVKGTYGVPIYEDMNHYTNSGMEKVQMGGGYMSSVSISFKRRINY